MIRLMKDEAIAMKTARESAVMTQFIPKGREQALVAVSPARTSGISEHEAASEIKTSSRLDQFLSLSDSLPMAGSINDPIIGTNTAVCMTALLDILTFYPELKRLFMEKKKEACPLLARRASLHQPMCSFGFITYCNYAVSGSVERTVIMISPGRIYFNKKID